MEYIKMKRMKNLRKTTIALILSVFISTISFAQTDKQISKAIKVFDKDYDKGIEKLEKYMGKANPKRIKAWNTLVLMESIRYERDKDIFKDIYVETDSTASEDKDSTDVSNDDVDDLIDLFKNFPYNRLVNLCRKATIIAESNEGDFRLRKVAIEVLDTDTTFSEKAKDYFEEGQEFFDKEDYELSILNFKKAIKEEPNYYRAYIKLGTSYWNEEKIDSAIKYYNLAKPIQPSYVEPYSYITNLLMSEELFFRAKKECIDALCVLPGLDIKLKFYRILNEENKYMDDHRLLRSFYPNKIGKEQDGLEGILKPYREAKDEISKYCDENGIIEENGKTKDKYLEVYSWRRILEELNEVPEYLDFAVQMEEEGYLDCYVLISLYHFDFYEQTKDFLSHQENKDKTKEYINKYLIKSYDD
jgi:tetratricopeptide (TPR) repeat protein